VLPIRQHRAIWGFAPSNRICDPHAPAVLTGRSSWMPTRHGAATAAAPRHLGFCSSAGNPRLGPPHSSAGVGEKLPPFTVVPPWPNRPIWSFTESPRIRSSMQTCGPAQNYLPFCAEDRAFAMVLRGKEIRNVTPARVSGHVRTDLERSLLTAVSRRTHRCESVSGDRHCVRRRAKQRRMVISVPECRTDKMSPIAATGRTELYGAAGTT
jgi:hypothetical protein